MTSIIPSVSFPTLGMARLTSGPLTSGSVLFAGPAGGISQDNANFFWDDTNNRLGIGTSSPSGALTIDGSADVIQLLVQGNATQTSLLSVWENSSGTDQITFSGTGAAVFNEAGNDADFRIEGDTDQNLFFVDASTDRIGIGLNAPSYQLEGTGQLKFLGNSAFGSNPQTNARLYVFSSSAIGSGLAGRGISIDTYDVSTATNSHFLQGLVFNANSYQGVGTTNTGYVRGIEGNAQMLGAGTVSTVAAGVFDANCRSGGGTTTNGYGLLVFVRQLSGGTMTNAYGLYLSDVTGASTSYGIYDVNSTRWYAATAKLGLGTATPGARIHISESSLGSKVLAITSQATNDDPELGFYQGRAATTDATLTTLLTTALSASTVYLLRARVSARRTGGAAGATDDGAGYVITAVYRLLAGTATIIGAVSVDFQAESQAAWNCTFNASGANVLLQVTGAANNNISWHATLEVSPISS